MSEGPAGIPRPLAEAKLVVELYYMLTEISVNEYRVQKRLNKAEVFPLETPVNYTVESEVGDFSNEIPTDTRVRIIVSAPIGRIKQLTSFGRDREVLSISSSKIDEIESIVNAEADKGADEIMLSVE